MRNYPRSTQAMSAFFVLLMVWLISTVYAGTGDMEAAKQAWPMIDSGALLIDVRSAEEFNEEHLDGAINIEWDKYEDLIAAIGEDKERPVVFYCRSGNRAGKSITELATKGYTHIFNATGLEVLKATKP